MYLEFGLLNGLNPGDVGSSDLHSLSTATGDGDDFVLLDAPDREIDVSETRNIKPFKKSN